MTYKVGDLVKYKDDDDYEDYGVMRVLECEDFSDKVLVTIGNHNDSHWVRGDEIELVISEDDIVVKESKVIVETTSNRTTDQIHQDICDMFAQVANYMQANLECETCELQVTAEFSSGDNVDVKFRARVRFNDWVECDELYKASRIALTRYKEDKLLNPRRISLHKEAS